MSDIRRGLLCLAGMSLLLAGCGRALSGPETSDVLYLRSSRGVAVVEAGSGSATFALDSGVPSPTWNTIARGVVKGNATSVIAIDASSGKEQWVTMAWGKLRPKVVSADGSLVVLGPRNEPMYGYGRARTRMVIASRDGETQEIDLEGNYEPEAFSTDGKSLFVIRFMPAGNPTRYQVRLLDLATGQVGGVYTPHEELQRAMGGTARIQAASPDGRRLYTLYTVGSGRDKQAFVHVLDLDAKWAHCIDLPDDFATDADSATALTVSPDGSRVYVANSVTGGLLEIDAAALQVTRSTESSFDPGRAHAAADSAGNVYVASGNRVVAFDLDGLRDRWAADMPERVGGLQVTADEDRVFVGLRSEVGSLDASSGKTLEMIDPPGIDRIRQLGPVLEFEEPTIVKCAC